jgi:two-component system sensor histidine kinase TtrS
MGAGAAEAEWLPTMLRLQRHVPEHDFTFAPLALEKLSEAVEREEVDFVITNPGHYVAMESAYGISRILTQIPARHGDAAHTTGSLVVTRKDGSAIRSLADLRGKTVAVVSTEAFGGFQIVWRELKDLGLEPGRDMHIAVTGFPMDNVLRMVESGAADAGIVRACFLEGVSDWRERLRPVAPTAQEDLMCLSSTRLYPGWAFAAARGTSPETARRAAVALLSMPPHPGMTGSMLWSTPADYMSVHDLFRELKIGPYSGLNDFSLRDVLFRYREWFVGPACLLLAWLLYTVRVDRLVRLRTAELRRSLEERQTLQENMREARERAEHLSRLSILGEMSGTLAHELNQPLATIAVYSQILKRKAENGTLTKDAARRIADEISGRTETADGVLQGIRAFARKRPARPEVVIPGETARQSVALFRGMQTHMPDVDLHDLLPEGTTLFADRLHIQQVLLNLLKNASDAMENTPAGLRRILLMLWSEHGCVHFSVRDFGVGLSQEQRAHLFEPFYSTKPDGLGLGLAICRSIAEACGGSLAVDTAPPPDMPPQPAGGATFTLIVPTPDAKVGHHDSVHTGCEDGTL